jgi:hypothetical protein
MSRKAAKRAKKNRGPELSVLSLRLCDFARDVFDFDSLPFDFIGLRRSLLKVYLRELLGYQISASDRCLQVISITTRKSQKFVYPVDRKRKRYYDSVKCNYLVHGDVLLRPAFKFDRHKK